MSKHTNRLARGLMMATALTVYQAPGCDFTLDQSMLQAFLDSTAPLGDVKFEFEFEAGEHFGEDHSGSSRDSHEDFENDDD